MILGVDHVALSTNAVDPGTAAAATAGYQTMFVQRDLANSATKAPYLSNYQPLHSIAYCQHENSVSLELTEHAAPLRSAPARYQVLFRGLPADTVPYAGPLPCDAEIWREVLGVSGAQPIAWKPFEGQCWREEGAVSGESGVRAVLVPVNEYERSLAFWMRGLQCRVEREGRTRGQRWAHLARLSPIRRWSLEIVLLESAMPLPEPFLDSPGFPCIAFLTNDLTSDLAALKDCGACVSETSAHRIHSKNLLIGFATGPSRELVELLQIQSTTGKAGA